jgi:hypothetical protein
MLGNGEHDAAPWAHRAEHLGEDRPVLFDVLEHVEGADDVELLLERHPADVHLEEGGVGGARARVREPLAEDLGSRAMRECWMLAA